MFKWIACCLPGLCLATALEAQTYWSPRTDWRGEDSSKLHSAWASQDIRVGNFVLRWDQEAQRLKVQSLEGRSLWESEAGKAFVMAGRGSEDVFQWRGSFTVNDKASGVLCREQSVDSITRDAAGVSVRGSLKGPACDISYVLGFQSASPTRLRFTLDFFEADHLNYARDINRSFLAFASQADEAFVGFGEQFSFINLKGRIVPILTTEQGHLRGRQPFSFLLNQVSKGAAGYWYTTYAAIPFYLTNLMHGLFLEGSEYASFDLRNPNRVEIAVWKSGLSGQIISASNPLAIVSAFSEYAGRMLPLPRWMHSGAIVGVMGGSSFVRDIWAKLKSLHTPIAAFWLQDWVGKRKTSLGVRMWWNWQLDTDVYPDWTELTKSFKAEGIATLGYVNPFLSDVSANPHHTRNFFREAEALGYLVLKPDGSPYEIDSGGFTGTLVDLTNPAAFRWYKDIIKNEMLAIGMKGWMADFGEALPFDARLHTGSAASVHNLYPELWARVNREAIAEAGLEGEAVAFLRSAYTQSPGSSQLFWLGDQMTTWDEHDGMKSAIAGLLSGGISGMSINHADIGGLITMQKSIGALPLINFYRSKELLLRGIEMAAFTAVFRTHEGNDPSTSFQFYSDDETLAFFARFAKIFAALADYREGLFQEAASKGYPVARHLLLQAPDDPIAWTITDQWFLGPDFLIAPVADPGLSERRVYLPKGSWTHVWSQSVFHSEKGQWITIPAAIGEPPVFFATGSAAGEDFLRKLKKLE